LLFSLAISLKFFAAIIFVPLILLLVKDLKKILIFGFFASIFCLLSAIAYLDNATFISNVSKLVETKLTSSDQNFQPIKLICMLLYILLCVKAYMLKKMAKKDFIKNSIFISYGAYVILFLMVKWHPQWIILLMPFLSLSYSYLKNIIFCFYIEMAGTFSFVTLTVNTWKDNVDQKMITLGPLSSIFDSYNIRMSDIINIHYFDYLGVNLKSILLCILYAYLLHPILLFVYDSKKNK
jgi:hypothetical protein